MGYKNNKYKKLFKIDCFWRPKMYKIKTFGILLGFCKRKISTSMVLEFAMQSITLKSLKSNRGLKNLMKTVHRGKLILDCFLNFSK